MYEKVVSTVKKEVIESGLLDNEPTRIYADEQQQFPGGTSALYEYIRTMAKKRYPQIAQEYGVRGAVFVSFHIERDGSISDVKVDKGVDPSLDAVAIKIVQDMPRWIPAKEKGTPVRSSYTVIVPFK